MEEIKSKLIKASEIYGNQTIIRAGINAIPFVGGTIDVLLSSYGNNFVIKRLESFISELQNQFEQLDNKKIDQSFFETEEGFDLIVKSFSSASRTRQKEKLRLYAKIIKGAITVGKEYEEDEPELYLKIVEELSLKELMVAQYLYQLKEIERKNPEDNNINSAQAEMTNDAKWLSAKYPEFREDELVSIFVRLEKTGLIKELVGSYLGYTGGKYLISPLFKKFYDFIESFE